MYLSLKHFEDFSNQGKKSGKIRSGKLRSRNSRSTNIHTPKKKVIKTIGEKKVFLERLSVYLVVFLSFLHSIFKTIFLVPF